MSKSISFSEYLTQVEEVVEQLQSDKSNLPDSEVIEIIFLLMDGLTHLPTSARIGLSLQSN